MFRLALSRYQAEFVDALDWRSVQAYTPDGLDFWGVLRVQASVDAELERTKGHPPTSWMGLDEQEKATIRNRRRLRVVPPSGDGSGADDAETAA